MLKTIKFFVFSFVLVSFIIPSASFAQTIPYPRADSSAKAGCIPGAKFSYLSGEACAKLTGNFTYGCFSTLGYNIFSGVKCAPMIKIISPIVRSSYKPGDTLNIEWIVAGTNNSNTSLGLNVYQKSKDYPGGRILTKTVGIGSPVVNDQTKSTGRYSWKIPDNAPEGADYIVYITNGEGWFMSDVFTIKKSAISAPTATITASSKAIISGQKSTVSWSSTNATTCLISPNGFSGLAGSQVVTPAMTTNYLLNCSGLGGTASSSITVTVATSTVATSTPPATALTALFARTSGFQGVSVSPNTSGVKLGSFTLSAVGQAVKVNSVIVSPVVTNGSITNYSNLTLKNGLTVLGTPVGNPSFGTTTFSFNDITVPANGSMTLDVYADIGGTSGSSITTGASIAVRNTSSSVSSVLSASGVTVNSVISSLATPILSSVSPVSQFVVGGSTFGIATYKLATASAGTQATVTEVDFATTGADAIESITVNGVTKMVAGSGSSATTTISGLNIPVSSTGIDIPVTVKFSGFQPAFQNGLLESVRDVKVTLSRVQASSGNGSAIYNYRQVPSNSMTLVASRPTVTVGSGTGSSQIILGSENKIGEFTVTADAAGKIGLSSVVLSVTSQGINNFNISGTRIASGNTTIPGATIVGSSTLWVSFSSSYEISAGQSKTFSIYAFVNGSQTSVATIPYVTSRLVSDPSLFKWVDIIGGNTQFTGSGLYNFPTNSYKTLSLNASSGRVLGDYIASSCTDLPRNIHRGEESMSTTNLQNFLVQRGFLIDTPTGFYGDSTVSAVKDYQASKGLPQTGMVYDFTRSAIKADSCN